jgi:hypothetical protein
VHQHCTTPHTVPSARLGQLPPRPNLRAVVVFIIQRPVCGASVSWRLRLGISTWHLLLLWPVDDAEDDCPCYHRPEYDRKNCTNEGSSPVGNKHHGHNDKSYYSCQYRTHDYAAGLPNRVAVVALTGATGVSSGTASTSVSASCTGSPRVASACAAAATSGSAGSLTGSASSL